MITRDTLLADLPELLRVQELAAWADCSKGVVYTSIRCDQLAHVKLGRLIRIPRSALEAWIADAKGRVA